MPRRKLTQEEVISQFIEVHGDKYDYSKVKYKDARSHVTIICPKHGEFPQTPNSHKRGKGCKKCYHEKPKSYKLTHDEVISQFIEVHGTKYDYSKVDYKGDNKKVTIICPKHGEFPQLPAIHKQGHGCRSCGVEQTNKHKTLTQEKIISQFREVHGDKYDYSLVECIDSKSKVKIICPKHGEFPQRADVHKRGRGCNKCFHENPKAYKLTQEEVISQFREVHGNKYDYSLVKYKGAKVEVKIICPKHGEFPQRADVHKAGSECPRCKAERYMVGKNEGEVFIPFMRDILSEYDVTLSEQHVVKSELGKYFIDLYIPEMKLAIEYDEKDHKRPLQKEKDKERQTYIENKLGCKFIRVEDKRFIDDNQYAKTLLETHFPNIKKETIEDLFI